MPPLPRRWEIAPRAPDSYLRALADVHPVVAQILYARGLTDPAEARAFLRKEMGPDDPFDLHGMHRAVDYIRRAIRRGDPIAVYGDFDADGVTATAILVLTLRSLGADVRPYIPHRVREGYGLNPRAVQELATTGIRLLITVDCGVRSPREIALARRLGMNVVVTDHHLVGEEPLAAVAVVNPRQPECPYPYKGLAGVGLAYKLAQALLRVNQKVPLKGSKPLSEEELLDLVALGTVADLAPLTGENRALVSRGLERLNASPRPGVEALMRVAGLAPGKVNAWAIGYVLAPRLNAPGRLEHADLAYRLLMAEYPEEAHRLAQQLDDLNRKRQQLTAETQERARAIVLAHQADWPLLFVADPEFPSGVVGLVAARLVEEFYRPAIVVERGEVVSRGSARSIPEFHIADALKACDDLLIRHGGHASAAGFTARTDLLNPLRDRLLEEAARQLAGLELAPAFRIDAEIPLKAATLPLWEAIQQLEPFGEGNPEPLFLTRNVQVRRAVAVGADGAHLKLTLSDGQAVWDGVAFGRGEEARRIPDRADIVYRLRRDDWNGAARIQLDLQDWRETK